MSDSEIDDAEQFRRTFDDDWPPLAAYEMPPFPVDALPPRIADWVRATAEETQTPPDLAALAVVGVLSAAALGVPPVDCGAWREELSLNILIAMPSGDRKSAVLEAASAPLRRLERERRRDAEADVRHDETRLDIAKGLRNKLIKKAADEDEPGKRGVLEDELRALDEKIVALGTPVMPRLLVDDTTPEALAGLLAQHGRMAVVSAESAFIDNIVRGRYSDGASNLHLVCRAYQGEPDTIDRKDRCVDIPRPLLSIVLAVQPHVLAALVRHETARAQGFTSRFAFAQPATSLGQRTINPARVASEILAEWEATVRRVFEAPKYPELPETRMTLTPEAKRLLDELRLEIEPRLGDGGDLAGIADWVGRHAGRVVRIAALLHLAEQTVERPIREDAMRSAVQIGGYLLAHGKAALLGHDHLSRRAFVFLRGRTRFTTRELYRGLAITVDDAKPLTERLISLGAIRERDDEDGLRGRGRPKGQVYDVNPRLSREGEDARPG